MSDELGECDKWHLRSIDAPAVFAAETGKEQRLQPACAAERYHQYLDDGALGSEF